jgi:hypothetical protein
VAPERDAVGRGAVRAAIENDTVLSTAIFQERVRVRAPGGIVSLNNHSELAAVPSRGKLPQVPEPLVSHFIYVTLRWMEAGSVRLPEGGGL